PSIEKDFSIPYYLNQLCVKLSFIYLQSYPTHTLLLLYSEQVLSAHFPMRLFLSATTPKQNLSAINKTVQHILYKKSESPASFLYNGQSHTAKLPPDIC